MKFKFGNAKAYLMTISYFFDIVFYIFSERNLHDLYLVYKPKVYDNSLWVELFLKIQKKFKYYIEIILNVQRYKKSQKN